PLLNRLKGNNPIILVAYAFANLVVDLAGLLTCLDPSPLSEVPQHPPLAETTFSHAPAKSRWENVHPAGIPVRPMTAPAEILLGVAFRIKLRSILCHPATHPLQRPVGLVGGRRSFELGQHRLR